MAGSYKHLCDDESPGGFTFDLIENMGDAHEACEECHWLIWFLSGGSQAKIDAALARRYEAVRILGIGQAETVPRTTNG